MNWTTLPRGTRTAQLNPYILDVWSVRENRSTIWKWTILSLQTHRFMASGSSPTELEAKEDATNEARLLLHPIK